MPVILSSPNLHISKFIHSHYSKMLHYLAFAALAAATATGPSFPATTTAQYFTLKVNITGAPIVNGYNFTRYHNSPLQPGTLDAYGGSNDTSGSVICQPDIMMSGYSPDGIPHDANGYWRLNGTGNSKTLNLYYDHESPRTSILPVQILPKTDSEDSTCRQATVGRCNDTYGSSAGPGTTGFAFHGTPVELVWRGYTGKDTFGSWVACPLPLQYYGPSLFYRYASEATPANCTDIKIFPEW